MSLVLSLVIATLINEFFSLGLFFQLYRPHFNRSTLLILVSAQFFICHHLYHHLQQDSVLGFHAMLLEQSSQPWLQAHHLPPPVTLCCRHTFACAAFLMLSVPAVPRIKETTVVTSTWITGLLVEPIAWTFFFPLLAKTCWISSFTRTCSVVPRHIFFYGACGMPNQ